MERKRILDIGCMLVAFLLIVSLLPDRLISGEEKERWEVFKPLVGRWEGQGSGFGDVSNVMHEWDVVLQGKFMRLRTRSVSQNKEKSEEIHEDVGYLSLDTDRDVYVFRQFLSEGFVNTFDVVLESADHLNVIFKYRESESAGGMRVRMRLSLISETSYDMALDLAGSGKEFTTCQQMHMKKVR
jgi:hypothetical protein